MRFAIYSRKSKFTGKGESIDNQIEMCSDYIKLHFSESENEITIYEDEGFSGKNLNRPQFQSMMRDEQNKPYDFIVVYRLDRISRNVGDFASLIDQLNRLGTSFICIKEQFDTSTPMGRAMMNIAAVFAQLERETIAERIKDNMYMLAKEGKWTGGTAPLGYKSVQKTYVDGGKERSYFVLEFDEDQIDLAKLIFSKYIQLQSVYAVEKYLNENEYKTQKGNDWDRNNLKRVLTNPIYCIADEDSLEYFTRHGSNVCFTSGDCDGKKGILTYNRYSGQKRELQDMTKWVVTISQHEGILTGKQWIKIQEIIQKNHQIYIGDSSQSRRSLNSRSILSGILFCSCGEYMRPKIYRSGTMYYVCERKDRKTKAECDISNVNGDELDEIVLNELFDYGKDGSVINLQFKSIQNKINSIDKGINKSIKKLKNQQDENDKQIEKLTMIITKSIELNTDAQVIQHYNDMISNIISENNKLDKRIKQLSETSIVQEDMTRNLKSMSEAIDYLKENFSKISVQQKREYVQRVIDKIIFDGKEIHIFIKGVS